MKIIQREEGDVGARETGAKRNLVSFNVGTALIEVTRGSWALGCTALTAPDCFF
jgi:hypothetical protein